MNNSRDADRPDRRAEQVARARGLAAAFALSPEMTAAIIEAAIRPTPSFRAVELSVVEPANGFAVQPFGQATTGQAT
jgi:hypothetical protein